MDGTERSWCAGRLTIRLVEQYDIAFVSTGDVLRKEIMAKSEVGKKAEAVVAKGGRSFAPRPHPPCHLDCPSRWRQADSGRVGV